MKKLLVLMISALLLVVTGQTAFADLENSATSHVYVIVDPNVAVGVIDANVDLGSIQMGEFNGSITFRVDANMEDVWLYAAVTDLFKGDDPTNSDVAPLPVVTSAGVTLTPTNANPFAGGSNVSVYSGSGVIGSFPAHMFSNIHFESSQDGHFSQDVDLECTWNQPDPEQPQGEYSGFIALYCFLTPDGE